MNFHCWYQLSVTVPLFTCFKHKSGVLVGDLQALLCASTSCRTKLWSVRLSHYNTTTAVRHCRVGGVHPSTTTTTTSHRTLLTRVVRRITAAGVVMGGVVTICLTAKLWPPCCATTLLQGGQSSTGDFRIHELGGREAGGTLHCTLRREKRFQLVNKKHF